MARCKSTFHSARPIMVPRSGGRERCPSMSLSPDMANAGTQGVCTGISQKNNAERAEKEEKRKGYQAKDRWGGRAIKAYQRIFREKDEDEGGGEGDIEEGGEVWARCSVTEGYVVLRSQAHRDGYRASSCAVCERRRETSSCTIQLRAGPGGVFFFVFFFLSFFSPSPSFFPSMLQPIQSREACAEDRGDSYRVRQVSDIA
jgi:hypothetical protein